MLYSRNSGHKSIYSTFSSGLGLMGNIKTKYNNYKNKIPYGEKIAKVGHLVESCIPPALFYNMYSRDYNRTTKSLSDIMERTSAGNNTPLQEEVYKTILEDVLPENKMGRIKRSLVPTKRARKHMMTKKVEKELEKIHFKPYVDYKTAERYYCNKTGQPFMTEEEYKTLNSDIEEIVDVSTRLGASKPASFALGEVALKFGELYLVHKII